MEPEDSLACSQEHSSGPYSELDQSSPFFWAFSPISSMHSSPSESWYMLCPFQLYLAKLLIKHFSPASCPPSLFCPKYSLQHHVLIYRQFMFLVMFSEMEYSPKSLGRISSQGLINEGGVRKWTILFDITSRKFKTNEERGQENRERNMKELRNWKNKRQTAVGGKWTLGRNKGTRLYIKWNNRTVSCFLEVLLRHWTLQLLLKC
jgi:hypothetical protein